MDYHKTKAWLKRNARPLECARWEYLFENGSKQQVIAKLAAFQNSDGGFGHGLEPDFTLPDSSAIATWTACQILDEVQINANDKMVTSIIDYLIHSYDKKLGLWRTVVPEHNQYPHASHWHYEEGVQENWMFNPSVELAAYLVHWSAEGSEGAALGWKVIENAKNHLFHSTKMGFHEVNNYQRLVQILKDKLSDLEEISRQVNKLAEQSIDKEPKSWGKSYKALPLNMIFSKDDDNYEKYKTLVHENLHYLKESIQDDGVWDITWEWDQYMEDFYVARQQWKGIIAVNNYKIFREFDFI
ncbi:hypothetical protein [Oceanobacillus sp. CFH 90083]|uniref:hypothetical protein n=1 Tax=Oceanobacillus sp. CFH 90083 TaxID=2592336 RepID=UPI00128D7395|nr:hypothetical protein [Oceanobacillus sp. CFH 90083]